ncbi:MAG: ABC transporter substrate-binding protein, partial [Myxococcota bacterium]|nr:ABC transporter substrate-binding protein [Myxococcota bacterium]
MLTRRDLLGGACAATLAGACRARDRSVVRVGFMTNLTHSPVMAGLATGRVARAINARVEALSFRAGPRVLEALIGDAIDVGIAGPAPIVYTHARHGGGALRILCGCASGGASLVVGSASGIRGPDDLRGKVLATPQIGTTQDIALRKYLRAHGYESAERGGDVTVHALDAATILLEVRRNALHGAWLPEPWATRLVLDAGAARLVDERDLWPNRAFPTALVVARGDFVRERGPLTERLVVALGEEVERALHDVPETQRIASAELARLLGKRLPPKLVEEAWRFVDFT